MPLPTLSRVREHRSLLLAALRTELPGVVERTGVVDRAGWVRANTASFASLIGKLEHDLLDQVVPVGGGFTVAAMALANRWITTRQLGVLLGFMGQRVLGQYDLALLSAEAAPGRLLFVEENIRQTAKALGVPLASFRTWIALHETTHAFEFEAHPWLRPNRRRPVCLNCMLPPCLPAPPGENTSGGARRSGFPKGPDPV